MSPSSPAAFSSLARELKRSEEHTSELQSRGHLVCRLLLEKKKHHLSDHRAVTDISIARFALEHLLRCALRGQRMKSRGRAWSVRYRYEQKTPDRKYAMDSV